MTAVRPEHEGAYGDPYGEPFSGADPYGSQSYGSGPYGSQPYGSEPAAGAGAFQAAVDALADPLNDPLPGTETAPAAPAQAAAGPAAELGADPGAGADAEHTSPWFRPHRPPEPVAAQQLQQAQPTQPEQSPQPEQPFWPDEAGLATPSWPVATEALQQDGSAAELVDWSPAADPGDDGGGSDPGGDGGDGDGDDRDDRGGDRRTVGLRRPEPAEFEGRAARRRAERERARKGARRGSRGSRGTRGSHGARARPRAKGGGRGRAAPGPPPPRPAGTRLEARRAERANREGPAIIASRLIGEVFISVGVLMLLFVAYQLWWTNVLAGQEAGGAADKLQEKWGGDVDPERRAGKFAPGEGFAIIHIPKIDIDTPIAQGVSKKQVLDKGMVGHYDQEPLNTAMPWDKKGNFALAGHRNTHGEPFRYINRLIGGDEIVVETADTYYTYKVASRLPSTSPSNTSVIDPVPPQSGFSEPGRYVTLTTCTPEFTSKYRLIVWGKLTDERPRSKGKPDALVE